MVGSAEAAVNSLAVLNPTLDAATLTVLVQHIPGASMSQIVKVSEGAIPRSEAAGGLRNQCRILFMQRVINS